MRLCLDVVFVNYLWYTTSQVYQSSRQSTEFIVRLSVRVPWPNVIMQRCLFEVREMTGSSNLPHPDHLVVHASLHDVFPYQQKCHYKRIALRKLFCTDQNTLPRFSPRREPRHQILPRHVFDNAWSKFNFQLSAILAKNALAPFSVLSCINFSPAKAEWDNCRLVACFIRHVGCSAFIEPWVAERSGGGRELLFGSARNRQTLAEASLTSLGKLPRALRACCRRSLFVRPGADTTGNKNF